jgi:Family of unknown function (DUF6029)
MKSWAAVFTVALCWFGAEAGLADEGRIQASNLLLHQVGRDAGSQEEEGTRFFDRVQLDYLSGVFRYGLRAEVYRTSEMGTVHESITQKYVEWRNRNLQVRVGNAYATIGRGLLFRAFELPGVVREISTFTDSKYMDSRDLEGAVVAGHYGRVEVMAMSGRPLAYPDSPPGVEYLARRDGTVSGGRVGVDLWRGLSLGSGYIRSDGFIFAGRTDTEEFGSLDATLEGSRLFPGLLDSGWDARFYAEYAGRNWSPVVDPLSTADRNPHARYTSLELSRERWTLTWETKHYRDFQLPFNDVPNLVPEVTAALVNRRSHFLFANDERGHLIGIQGAVFGDWIIHGERADARIGEEPNLWRYRLNYLEVASPSLKDTRGTLFVSEGRDDLEGLTNHRTIGFTAERSLSTTDAVTTEFEVQDIERIGSDAPLTDIYAALAYSRAGLGSISVVLERSDDPTVTDDPFTLDIETKRRQWLGVIVQAPLDRNHEVSVFAGKRRGGTACISGTCYLVPDFSGIEARLTSRF